MLKDEYGMSPSEASYVAGFIIPLAWVVKPIWGFVSDTYPIFGYRRRSYLALASLLTSVIWVGLAAGEGTSKYLTIALLCMVQITIAFMNVVAEAIIVERSHYLGFASAGKLLGVFWFLLYSSIAIFGFLGGYLLEFISVRAVFALCALPPLVVLCMSVCGMSGTRVDGDINTCKQFQQVFTFMANDTVWKPLLFLFLYYLVPASDSAFFYFYTKKLDFSPSMVSGIMAAGSIPYLSLS
jgi:MFS family permease